MLSPALSAGFTISNSNLDGSAALPFFIILIGCQIVFLSQLS